MTRTRQILLGALGALVAVSVYFIVLLDLVMPALVRRHLLFLWWCLLGVYLILLFGYGCWSLLKSRPSMAVLGFVLLVITAYAYDPTIEPFLRSIHLGWLWIVSLAGLFFWMFFSQSHNERTE